LLNKSSFILRIHFNNIRLYFSKSYGNLNDCYTLTITFLSHPFEVILFIYLVIYGLFNNKVRTLDSAFFKVLFTIQYAREKCGHVLIWGTMPAFLQMH
jgi:hypothetical protein